MRITDEANTYLVASRKEGEIFNDVVTPGRYHVELFPWLVYLPSWFPGARFKRDANQWRPSVNFAQNLLYDTVQRAMVSSQNVDSS